VTLDEFHWEMKLKNHPEMVGCHKYISTCLEDPTYVYSDVSHPDSRQCFYRPFTLPEPYRNTFLKVVVECLTGDAEGRVLSAYPTVNIKPGEVQLWPPLTT